MILYSLKNPTPVFTYLKEYIPHSVKEMIDKILDYFFKALQRLHQDPLSKETFLLSWCFVHLINIVDNFSHGIPYIVSKKFKGLDSTVDDSKATSFIDLLIESFKYQPYLAENLIVALLEKSKGFFVSSGSGDKPIDLTAVLAFEVLGSVVRSLKQVYETYSKEPSHYKILMMENILKLLYTLQLKRFGDITNGLSKEEGAKFFDLLEALVSQIYTIYCDLSLKDHGHNLDFPKAVALVSDLYRACSTYTIEKQKSWNEANLAFILNKLETFKQEKTAPEELNPLEIQCYSELTLEGKIVVDNRLNTSSSQAKTYSSENRYSSVIYYYLRMPSSIAATAQKDDLELCTKAKENSMKTHSFNFQRDCLESFISFYSQFGSFVEKPIKEKLITEVKPQGVEGLAKISNILDDQLLQRLKLKEAAAKKTQELQASLQENAQQQSIPAEKKEEESKKEILAEIQKPKPAETSKTQINIESEKKLQISDNKETAISNKKELSVTEEFDITLLTDGLFEMFFELSKQDIMKRLENLLRDQKYFMEAVFTDELPYSLPNASVDIFEFQQNRGNTLRRFLKGLDPFQMKFFWLFLPATFRTLIKNHTEADYNLYNLCMDTIRQTTGMNDLAQYHNTRLFAALDRKFYHYKRLLTQNAVKKEKEAEKPAGNPQKNEVPVEALVYTEAEEKANQEKAIAFYESPQDHKRAASALSWLDLPDSQIEIITLQTACAPRSVICLEAYQILLINPLNELRFIAFLLDLLEDPTLEVIKAIAAKYNFQRNVTYESVCSNILGILSQISINDYRPIIALKVPASYLSRYRLSSIERKYPEEFGQLNGLERILNLLFSDSLSQNDPIITSIIQFAANYTSKTQFCAVKKPSAFPLGQLLYQMISIELTEKLWFSIIDIWKRNRTLLPDNNWQELLGALMKNCSSFSVLRPVILQTYIPIIKAAKEKISSALTQLAQTEKFADSLHQLYHSFATELTSLNYIVDAVSKNVLQYFKGVTGRREFHERNKQTNGALGKWGSAIRELIVELAASEDTKELILSMLEIICLESKHHEAQNVSNFHGSISEASSALFRVLVEFKAILVTGLEIAVPTKKLSDYATNQLGEIGMTKQYSALQRYVSTDIKEVPEVLPITMSFQQMKEASNVELDNIYLHSVMRINRKLLLELLRKWNGSELGKKIFAAKFSFFQDLPQKEASAGIRSAPTSGRGILDFLMPSC